MYQWLLFDADGTLFDYDLAEAKALEGAFRDFDIPFDAQVAENYRVINHQIWVDFEQGLVTAEALRVLRFERLFTKQHISMAAGLFSERYLFHLSQASDLIEGAEDVLRALLKTHQLAIITNGLKDVQRPRLARSTIRDCFKGLFISEEIGIAKPDPRFFEIALDRIGRPRRENVLVIGDSLTSDIQGGNNAGIDTCWYNPTAVPAAAHFPAVYEIRRLEELLPLLI